MRRSGFEARPKCRPTIAWLAIATACVFISTNTRQASGQRVFGLDTSSAANGSAPSQTAWNNAFNDADGDGIAYKFAFVRSNHGIPATGGTDDSQFYLNISRGTTAGLLVGSYNYIEAGANTAIAEANHYLDRAGMYMKPGYLLPVFDLEGSGSASLSQAALTQWSLDYINTIFTAKGINPIVYTNSSFNNDEVTAAVAFTNIASSPHTGNRTYQWLARPSGSLTTGEPGQATGYPDPYGGWDPNFTTKSASIDPAIKPWAFWQNGSGSPNGFLIDYNAANGNIEFVKDFLVPALWTNAGSGDWGTTSNWNSDNPSYDGTVQNGPAPRLPNSANLDWVKLQNSGGGTVTLSSGARTVRKFYTQQTFNMTGGSLSVGYLPGSGGKWDLPSEFNAVVTLSAGAAYSAHTTQVDGGGGQFNINGGTVTFRSLELASHAANPGKIVMGGDVTLVPSTLGGTGTAVIRSTGALAQSGLVDLGGAVRTFTVSDGAPAIDVLIQAPVVGTGGFKKAGAGTLQLAGTNTYTGGTTFSEGVAIITKDANLGAAPGAPDAANITLDGGTLKTGSEVTSISLANVGSGYTSFPTVSFGGAGADGVAPSANVLGKISTIQVTAGGSGYTGTVAVILVGGGGTGATATATMALDATGVTNKVASITITNQGSGYTSVPTVYITDGSGQGVAGSGAAAVVNGVTLTGFSINGRGFDYASPSVTLNGGGGSGAAATAVASTNITLNGNRGITLTANGGTLHQTAGTDLAVNGTISGVGALTKSGPGTLSLSAANTFGGGMTITNGFVNLSGAAATLGSGNVAVQGTNLGTSLAIHTGVANAISDTAALSLLGGGTAGTADQGFVNLGSGITEIVQSLVLGGSAQEAGTYGSSTSNAMFKFDEYFAGTGVISVVNLPGDFNADGIVDTADYLVWRKNVGQPAGTLINDNTGAAIGDGQYNLWRASFGNQLGVGSSLNSDGSAVPEPCSIALGIVALAGVGAWRRYRRR